MKVKTSFPETDWTEIRKDQERRLASMLAKLRRAAIFAEECAKDGEMDETDQYLYSARSALEHATTLTHSVRQARQNERDTQIQNGEI